jgi:uncharacterized membrane protein YtjA (UPF0391 family)
MPEFSLCPVGPPIAWSKIRSGTLHQEEHMLRAAIAFFILAIVAFVLGASGIAGLSMEIGRMLLIVFLILAVISFVMNMMSGRKGKM